MLRQRISLGSYALTLPCYPQHATDPDAKILRNSPNALPAGARATDFLFLLGIEPGPT